MARYAVINSDNIVENIIEASPDFEIPDKTLVLVGENCGIGGTYVDGIFTSPVAPEPDIPDRVSSRQFMLQLDAVGLLDSVESWIETQPKSIQLAFQCSATFVRTDEMMQLGFNALGFTSEQIDAFFLAANLL